MDNSAVDLFTKLTSDLAALNTLVTSYQSTITELQTQMQNQSASPKTDELMQKLTTVDAELVETKHQLAAKDDQLMQKLAAKDAELVEATHQLTQKLTAAEALINQKDAELMETKHQLAAKDVMLKSSGDKDVQIKTLTQQLTDQMNKNQGLTVKAQTSDQTVAQLQTNINNLMVHAQFTTWIQTQHPQLCQQLFTQFNSQQHPQPQPR